MMYSDLRRMIMDVCYGDLCTFDSIYVLPELEPWFARVNEANTESEASRILRDYIAQNVKLKNFTVKLDGREYPIVVNSRFKGKVPSAIRTTYTIDHLRKTTKKILVCLANLEQVLINGEKTKLVPSAKKHNKHKGDDWIYAREVIQDPELKGSVIVEILIPKKKKDSNSPIGVNLLYHTTVRGASGFGARNGTVSRYLAEEGEVKVTL